MSVSVLSLSLSLSLCFLFKSRTEVKSFLCIMFLSGTFCNIGLVWPPPCNSDHQDYYMFSRGFLLTFTFHCYKEGAVSKISVCFAVDFVFDCCRIVDLGVYIRFDGFGYAIT